MKVLISLIFASVAAFCLLVAGCSTNGANASSSYSRCKSASCKTPAKQQSSKMHLYAK